MDEPAFEAQLRRDGFDEILRKDLPPDGRLDAHEHDWDVQGLVVAGEFTITTTDGRRTYRAGESFFLPANMPHEESQGPQGARLLLGRRRTGKAGVR